jgi:hypothetical protein
MIFIDWNWVSTRWQWWVNLYKVGNRQLYREGETIHKTIPKHRILKIENNVQNKKSNIKRTLKT